MSSLPNGNISYNYIAYLGEIAHIGDEIAEISKISKSKKKISKSKNDALAKKKLNFDTRERENEMKCKFN